MSYTAFTFSIEQRNKLSQMLIDARSRPVGERGYWAIYNYLIECITGSGQAAASNADVQQVLTFFRGAALINQDVSILSPVVRGYTARQVVLRADTAVTESALADDIQTASDKICDAIVSEILNSDPNANHALPTLDLIALEDATAAVSSASPVLALGKGIFAIYIDNESDSARAWASGWAGTPFFSDGGSYQMWRLISDDTIVAGQPDEQNINKLEDLKNVLYALDAMAYAQRSSLSVVPTQFSLEILENSSLLAPQVAQSIMSDMLHALLQGGSVDWNAAAGATLQRLASSGSPALADLFAGMGALGEGSVLDQIRGS